MKGLYIHIPFCEYICHYCDFVKRVPKDQNMIDTYLIRLRDEIQTYQKHFDSIETIYIGGGTPSMLTVDQLTYLFDSLKAIHPMEFSIEVNPESYTFEKGEVFKKYGVNRVSLGVQSFDDKILAYMNRGHKTEQIESIIKHLKSIGIKDISVDLIFAIPGQTMDHIKHDLEQFIKLDIDHISYYSLILEDKTYFYHQYLKGNFKPMDEDIEAEMYHYIIDFLESKGYEQYEVSNFARDNHYSLHNSIYWTLGEYIGVGMGAHGFIDNERTYNERGMSQYLDHFTKERMPQTDELKLQDELIFGLRMTKGVDIHKIEKTYGINLFEKYPQIQDKIELGLLRLKDHHLQLTKEGMMLGNQVFMLFI
ncbi:radical SAM family heme chaperone HemW [Acholeplasma equirhinis]|uniref:radical SAM family heme chaperone HemW n=1 Tax=Acholeplasma equirhinis TaxID=555393 RepID=UPI00197A8543|nr:radical SAM family heme chaperone HemW [Acholeplasma equirhinis]MBN3490362.1 radical SAM family heme chaperone HemW [Acholeplasma equirhinis]